MFDGSPCPARRTVEHHHRPGSLLPGTEAFIQLVAMSRNEIRNSFEELWGSSDTSTRCLPELGWTFMNTN